jgi:Tol biopolymer transport system component
MTLRRTAFVVAIAALMMTPLVRGQQSTTSRQAEAALQAAMNREIVAGDLTGAIKDYRGIVTEYGRSDQAVAARALMRAAGAYEKLGKPADARSAYQQVLAQFPDRLDVAARSRARARLATLSQARPQLQIEPRRITALPPSGAVAVNPDGRLVAIVDNDGNLLVRDVSTSQTDVVVKGSGRSGINRPVFSPDSRRIAYQWNDDAKSAAPWRRSLRVVDVRAGAKPAILVDDPRYASILPYDWSADGTAILVKRAAGELGSEIAWVSATDGAARVIKSSPPGRQLFQPKASPDGQYVAYRSSGRIHVLRPDGTEIEVAEGANTTWTADGSHLLFTTNDVPRRESALRAVKMLSGQVAGPPFLLKANVGEMDLQRVTQSDSLQYFNWTGGAAAAPRAGSQVIVLERHPSGPGGQAPAKAITTFPGSGGKWSPDGRSIAFWRSAGTLNLVVRDLDSGEERLYSRTGIRLLPPVWFQDGSRILVTVIETPEGEEPQKGAYYSVNVQTGAFDRLFPTHTAGRHRAWVAALSADDTTLIVPAAAGDGAPPAGFTEMAAIDLATATERTLFTLEPGGAVRVPGVKLGPGGRTLLFGSNLPEPVQPAQTTLYQIDTDGTNYRRLHGTFFNGGGGCAGRCTWEPDGRLVFTEVNPIEGTWRLMRLPAGGGAPQPEGLDSATLRRSHPNVVNGPWPGSIDISPDGTRILVTHVAAGAELWAIDNVTALLTAAR